MDSDKQANEWMDKQAELGHDPSLAAIGARTRGMTQPPAHTATQMELNK